MAKNLALLATNTQPHQPITKPSNGGEETNSPSHRHPQTVSAHLSPPSSQHHQIRDARLTTPSFPTPKRPSPQPCQASPKTAKPNSTASPATPLQTSCRRRPKLPYSLIPSIAAPSIFFPSPTPPSNLRLLLGNTQCRTSLVRRDQEIPNPRISGSYTRDLDGLSTYHLH